jgi:hypothetical protein
MSSSLEETKQFIGRLQDDIQIHIIEDYIKPQIEQDELKVLVNEFDKLLMSEDCRRLKWEVLTEVVGKIIKSGDAAIDAVSKSYPDMGFRGTYYQHFVRKINTFKHSSFDNDPLSSMCATIVMQKWH